jgi:predicted ATP-dependent serine protease
LQKLTDYCKEHQAIGIIINQVGKSGKFSGSNKLKHMVDSHIHLSIEEKDEDFKGCRILECRKNRFGGSAAAFILKLGRTGFKTIAKLDF